MTFDREDQKQLFLSLIENSNFSGKGIENVYKVLQEIKTSKVITLIENSIQHKAKNNNGNGSLNAEAAKA